MSITAINEFSLAWAATLWKASWQGGIALLLVLLLSVAVRRIPAHASCWLWRLAFLKLLLAGLWIVPIELPVLPVAASRAATPPLPPTLPKPTRIIEPTIDEPLPSTASSKPANTALIGGQKAPAIRRPLSGLTWLLMAWCSGVLVYLMSLARQWLSVRRMLRGLALTTNDAVVRAIEEGCRRFGISCPPAICISYDVETPCQVGIVRPVIVLPAALLESCSSDVLNAVLMHELAHIKRRDLLWNWLPAVAEVLFYFHPLVWLAKREWRLAQEIATDELAITISRVDPARYAGSLMELVARCRPSTLHPHLAVGVSETYAQLSRRMTAMLTFRELTMRRRVTAAVTVMILATGGLIPWKLTAQEARTEPPAEPSSPAAAPSKSPTAAETAVIALGGEVVHDEQRPERPLIAISYFKRPIKDADLAVVKDLTTLRALTLDASNVTDAGLAHLKGLTNLQALDLNETQITDAGLAHLTGLTKLIQLGLIGTRISDNGLVHIKERTEMYMLLLGRTNITDKGLVHLKGLTKLQTLELGGTRVTNAGLEQLKGMTELRDLRLNETRITDVGLHHLKDLPKLQTLILNTTRVRGEGLAHLRKLPDLHTLWLIGTEISDAGLVHLYEFTRLKRLNLSSNKHVTDAAVRKLQTALPNCQIDWTFSVKTNLPQFAKSAPDADVAIVQPLPDPRLLKLPLERQICEFLPPVWARRLDDTPGSRKGARRPMVLDDRRMMWWETILELDTGKRVREFAFGKDDLVRNPLLLNPSRRFLLVNCFPDGNNRQGFTTDFTTWFQVWDTATEKMVGANVNPVGLGWSNSLYANDVTTDGKSVASVNQTENEVSVWDVATGQRIKTMPVNLDRFAKGYEGRAPFFRPEFLRFSPDGKWLVTFTANRALYWKWQTNEEPVVIELGRRLETFAFSPDSRYVAEGPGPRHNIEIRDLDTLKVVKTLDDGAKLSMITSGLSFTLDGSKLIAGNDITVDENKLKIPHRLHMWDFATGKLINQLAMPIYRPRYLDISPNGRRMVVYLESNFDAAIAVWDLKELEQAPR